MGKLDPNLLPLTRIKCQMDQNSNCENETTTQVLEENMGRFPWVWEKSLCDSNHVRTHGSAGTRRSSWEKGRGAAFSLMQHLPFPISAKWLSPARVPWVKGRHVELLRERDWKPIRLAQFSAPTPPWRKGKKVSLLCLAKGKNIQKKPRPTPK